MLFITIAFAVYGLLIGSFLNVVILRKGVEKITGRSHCSSCGHTLYWYDLVPVFSWIILRGRCRTCGSRISWQYPLVEITNALLYALVGGVFAVHVFVTPFILLAILTLIQLIVVSILLAITVYDLRHTIIPDEWVALFAVLSLILALLFPLAANNSKLVAVLAGPAAALPLFLLWLISGGRWMGLGDPKLALGIGWLLGFPLGIIAIFFSFILGSAILLPVMAFEKIITHMRVYRTMRHGLTIKSEVPFGPFLIASTLLLWFFQLYGIAFPLDILGLY